MRTLFAILAVLLVVVAVACAMQNLHRPPRPLVSPMDRAPDPESAEEGVSLQIMYERAVAKLNDAHDRAAEANKALGVIRWASWLAFLAVPVAWLIGGVRPAVIALLVAVGLAFAPTVLGDLWEILKWPAAIGCAVVAAAYVALWFHRLWVNHRLVKSRDDQLAGGHVEGAAAVEVVRQGAENKPDERKVIKEQMVSLVGN